MTLEQLDQTEIMRLEDDGGPVRDIEEGDRVVQLPRLPVLDPERVQLDILAD